MSNAEPLRISIVTPSLNQRRFLFEALVSVKQQGYRAHEHIVLDGGSADGSPALLKQFTDLATTSDFIWKSESDRGQSAALNEGFRIATGDIVGWLNADDRYRPNCFANVAAFFAANPEVDVLYGDYTFMDEKGRHLKLRREIEFSKFILNYHRILYIPTTSTFFRRRIFDDGHLLREDLHYAMDLEFFIRLARKGYSFHHLSQVLADFRVHAHSKSVAGKAMHHTEHREVVASQTPISQWIRWPWARTGAAMLLQLPAGCLRYGEKLLRGYYLTDMRLGLSDQGRIQIGEQP